MSEEQLGRFLERESMEENQLQRYQLEVPEAQNYERLQSTLVEYLQLFLYSSIQQLLAAVEEEVGE